MRISAAWVVVVLGLLAAPAGAAPILIINGGILEGATGVVVGSNTYDVSFLDGTCAALFTGCDQVTDFTFQTPADAVSAAQALLDSVFLDGPAGAFDTNPALTRGCVSLSGCFVLLPRATTGAVFTATTAVNDTQELVDQVIVAGAAGLISVDTAGAATLTWAVFTPAAVPEPASLTLLALGLGGVGLGWYRRRRQS